jgi:hypothetical protein
MGRDGEIIKTTPSKTRNVWEDYKRAVTVKYKNNAVT